MQRRSVVKQMLVGGACAMLFSMPALAQNQYPSHAVRVVVPFPAGNAVDLIARISADALAAKYKQTFVVDNRAGAKGIIGIRYALEQRPDGYTLVGGGLGNVLPVATLRNLPIDIPTALVPVAQVAEFANVILVRANSPFNTMQDLVDHIKKMPKGHVTVGAGDIGSSAHMAAKLFEDRIGMPVTNVPYRGQNEIVVNLIGETLDVGISSVPASLAMLRSGRVKALAITGKTRSKHIPDVPTMEESGIRDYNISSWLGLYAIEGTPANIVKQLGADLIEALKSEEYQSKIESAGLDVSILGPEAFAQVNRSETKRWTEFAEQIGAVSNYAPNGK